MIKLKGVNKYFNKGKKNEIHVINDTTLDLGEKGLVALLGPSGSGKTTMLNAIGGLDKVNKGDIFVDGVKITGRGSSKVDEIRNLNIGYIFQDYKLVDSMTVYENVAMVLRMIGIKDEEEIKKRITYILETLGIYRYRNRMADMLSGGERQRVGIARAIAKNPKIIIADEPTGNLDSANTIEIMNIIKAISRDRLVVLVTHEVELAKFYASRIVELKDGKIVNDYENITDDNLDYRIDNKFYLKDFEKHETACGDSVNMNFYGGKDDKLDIDIVIKNGNIYIKSNTDKRIEVIDSGSSIEFVDDHYKQIDKSLYEEYNFEFDKVVDNSIKEKYSSIIGFFPSLARGFKKIGRYSLMKKLLFIGFMLAGVFITASLSSIYAGFDIQDKDFIESNKEYLSIEVPKVDVNKYAAYENLDSVEHIFPGDAKVSLMFKMNFYYQSTDAAGTLEGVMTDINSLDRSELIAGRMAENPQEIVLDKLVIDRFLKYSSAPQVGIDSYEKMIDQKLSIEPLKEFTIVGITDKVQPLVYVSPSLFTDMKYNSSGGEEEDMEVKQIFNYATYGKEFSLAKGRLPENDYETIVPESRKYDMPLNKEIDTKVNGRKLKVVGYYKSPESAENFLVNENTIKYSMITKAKGFTIMPTDRDAAMEAFREQGLDVKGTYDRERDKYIESQREGVMNNLLVSLVMIAISLIEILLMIRSSFLSRIKEVGIYRAIGVKKTDIYKMFLGEIFAITTVSSLVGIGVMSYILYHLCQIEYIASQLAINPIVIGGAIIIVYLFNSIVGLIPVFNTMRKSPAAILSRQDVD